jgi:4-amino-4-deoxy-L-arabinose transferase-like glycosyltransferase
MMSFMSPRMVGLPRVGGILDHSPERMEAATVARPERAPSPHSTTPRRDRGARAAAQHSRDLIRPALGVLLVATFVLRLWGIKQGLPYSYNVDEATHFVPRAIGFFGHDLNPHYFLNPPAYSYLLHVVFELWFGGRDAVTHAYVTDPTSVFIVARLVAAVLGTVAVWLTFLAAARLFDRAVALAAAAVFGLAFLPIFYSHLALNDVPTLAPVALSLYGIAGVLRRGRKRDYALAGLGVGLAAATKYTGGVTLLCLLAAFVCDAAGGGRAKAARGVVLCLLTAFVAFIAANPYAILDWNAFRDGVSSQASLAAGEDPVKLGTTEGSGITYYLWSFTWGLGWAPTLAALGGAVLLAVRRRLAMVLVLLPAPIAFIIFMGDQQRFFGRWLMPIFPIVAILAGYGAVSLVRWAVRRRGVPLAIATAVAGVVLLTQSVITVIHNDAVLSRPDTRTVARQWMVGHVPAGARVVLEPLVPDNWATDVGGALPWTPDGERWSRYPTWLTTLDKQGHALPAGQTRFLLVDQYERTLQPAMIDQYVRKGYCWVLVGSLQAGRAFAQPRAAPNAIAYYDALARRGRLVHHVSPFARGSSAIPFSFDWSIDYYPPQYRTPGPELSLYQLSGGRCASRSATTP